MEVDGGDMPSAIFSVGVEALKLPVNKPTSVKQSSSTSVEICVG